ncbi:hypothetical protein [Deinococcus hopiensis]|uniref:hypothetical protein n=1 Tax=Deinococcus hopiensis TaxID=309885 RepID=UPI001FEB4B92|nr:hypothetical protein [Deinococcus hopiensis]
MSAFSPTAPPSPRPHAPPLFMPVTAFLFAVGIGLVFPVLPYIVAQHVPRSRSRPL